MMLTWKIRYLDRSDKQFKDRYLYLNTAALDSVLRAAVELVVDRRSGTPGREIIKYRRLFTEGDLENSPVQQTAWDSHHIFGVEEYFEDEACGELNSDEVAQILTASPTARSIPPGAKQHHIEFMSSEPTPIPIVEVSLNSSDLRLLGYFGRDLRELCNSVFIQNSPASLKSVGRSMGERGSTATVETAATDDEIRSFVTIFRRLYMAGEPGNFRKAAEVFVASVGDHRYGRLMAGLAQDYEEQLQSVPDSRPIFQPGTTTFTVKRLIDVFLNTQYAHQPAPWSSPWIVDSGKVVYS